MTNESKKSDTEAEFSDEMLNEIRRAYNESEIFLLSGAHRAAKEKLRKFLFNDRAEEKE